MLEVQLHPVGDMLVAAFLDFRPDLERGYVRWRLMERTAALRILGIIEKPEGKTP